jgi:hypothetical protein
MRAQDERHLRHLNALASKAPRHASVDECCRFPGWSASGRYGILFHHNSGDNWPQQ